MVFREKSKVGVFCGRVRLIADVTVGFRSECVYYLQALVMEEKTGKVATLAWRTPNGKEIERMKIGTWVSVVGKVELEPQTGRKYIMAMDLGGSPSVKIESDKITPYLMEKTSLSKGTECPVAVAVDFDGCLVENKWPEIGEPNVALFDVLIEFRKLGGELILWTNREGEALEQAVAFCKEQGLEFDAVNENLENWKRMFGNDTRKVGADYYLDDKAVCVKANWRDVH